VDAELLGDCGAAEFGGKVLATPWPVDGEPGDVACGRVAEDEVKVLLEPSTEAEAAVFGDDVDGKVRLAVPESAAVDELAVEHCKFEDVIKGRTLVPFTMKETSSQSLMLRLFTA